MSTSKTTGIRATFHIVRLDSEKFLEDERRAVAFERPNFHFPEALTTGPRFATKRLLGNKRIGTRCTSVDFVVNQVVQFDEVHVADCVALLERLASTAVEQLDLATEWHLRKQFGG